MRRAAFLATILISILFVGPALRPQTPPPQPLTLPLACAGKDCSLLRGKPQTAGMRSGYVRLEPGETVGWHSTGKNEETLVVLKGSGEALIKGRAGMPFEAPHLVYIPPASEHNVKNTGSQVLEYVYVVAPAGSP
jgi:mannose-6-phosphate isomerase-like protein (cupin superfamily)